jgi:hypothetical protein
MSSYGGRPPLFFWRSFLKARFNTKRNASQLICPSIFTKEPRKNAQYFMRGSMGLRVESTAQDVRLRQIILCLSCLLVYYVSSFLSRFLDAPQRNIEFMEDDKIIKVKLCVSAWEFLTRFDGYKICPALPGGLVDNSLAGKTR